MSLATPRPLEKDNAVGAAPPCETFAEIMYVAQGCLLKALVLLSLGLKNDDGTPIFDPLVLPWSAAARPSSLKWTAKELCSEITRRRRERSECTMSQSVAREKSNRLVD